MLNDLKFGARMLLRRPAFTAVAVLSLALGIGLSTTMFSVVNAVMFAPTAAHEPERLVEIYTSPHAEVPYLATSWPDYLDIAAQTNAFSGTAAYAMVRGLYRGGAERAQIVRGEVVSDTYFDVLGVRPVLGRSFSPEENRTELTHPVVVLSNGFWKRRLGSDPAVVGSLIELSGVKYTVVGVAPASFKGMIPGYLPEFWAPLMMIEKLSFNGIQAQASAAPGVTRLQQRGTRWLLVAARLAAGRTIEEARAQVKTVGARLVADHPEENKNLTVAVLPAAAVRFHPMIDGYLPPVAAVLMGAVGLVLLIACANVASMLLARATGRRREMALRLAIGAPRGRLVRQLLAESACLAVLSGVCGLALAFAGGRLLSNLDLPLPLTMTFDFGLDVRVLAFAVLASVCTAFLFGLVPALQTSKPALVPALRADGGGTVGAGLARGPFGLRFSLRHALVTGQLALSLVLLVAGALLIRALTAADGLKPGFDADRIAVLSWNLGMNGYDVAQARTFQDRVAARLRETPGVETVALVSRPPLAADQNMEAIRLPGQQGPADEPILVDAAAVDSGYFAALDVPILEGRAFTDADTEGAPDVVIVNETAAKRFWPGRSALGERIYTDGFDKPSHEVVGVVRDYNVRELGEKGRPYLHTPWRQQKSRLTTVMVRTAGPAVASLGSLRSAILAMEPAIAFTDEGTEADILKLTLGPTRVAAVMLGAFGALALLLAAIGLYGVVAYTVEQRTRELGLRLALGASVRDVIRLVLGQGMRLALTGIVLGAAGAAALARVLGSLLYGVSAIDPLAYIGAALLLVAVALLAHWAPARRATRVNPMTALRSE